MKPPRTQFHTAILVIEGYAAATSSLDNTLDAISLEVEEALVSSVTRGGLARDTRVTRIKAEYADDGEQPVGVIRIEAEIDYVVVEKIWRTPHETSATNSRRWQRGNRGHGTAC